MAHIKGVDEARSDFSFYATGSTGVVTSGAAGHPLLDRMNPSADALTLSSIRIDVSAIKPRTQLAVAWQGKQVFLRAGTQPAIEEAPSTPLTGLPD